MIPPRGISVQYLQIKQIKVFSFSTASDRLTAAESLRMVFFAWEGRNLLLIDMTEFLMTNEIHTDFELFSVFLLLPVDDRLSDLRGVGESEP